VLSVHDGETTAFDRSDDHRRKFRPVEVLRDLNDVGRAAAAAFPLVFGVNHQALNCDPFKERRWAQRPESERKNACHRAAADFGRCDILINNAGINVRKRPEQFRR
jgi:NAD(P)-dependent dehydrogenase (short-subunit alcohol dehydrogenase family)